MNLLADSSVEIKPILNSLITSALHLTICILIESSFWFDTIKLGYCIVYIYGCWLII